MESKKKENFINYWEYLELPMNSPLRDIKLAFQRKVIQIEGKIQNGKIKTEEISTLINELTIATNAYETLSDPYKRFIHNCEIDGEKPFLPDDDEWGRGGSWEVETETSNDLGPIQNMNFVEWLEQLAEKYVSFLWTNSKILSEDDLSKCSQLIVKLNDLAEKTNRQTSSNRRYRTN